MNMDEKTSQEKLKLVQYIAYISRVCQRACRTSTIDGYIQVETSPARVCLPWDLPVSVTQRPVLIITTCKRASLCREMRIKCAEQRQVVLCASNSPMSGRQRVA